MDTIDPTAQINGGPGQNSFVNDKTPTFGIVAADTNLTLVTCQLDTGSASACSSGSRTLGPLGDGQHTFTLPAADAAGHTASATRAWTVDTQAPTTATFVFSSSNDAVSLICSLDGAPFYTCDGNSVPLMGLKNGLHTFKARATERAGNVSNEVSRSWTVTNPPAASFSYAPPAPRTGERVTFSDTSTSPTGPIASRTWDLDNDGQYNDASGATATRIFTRPGSYVVRLRVVDSAGGVDMAARTVVVGNRPPEAKFLVVPANPAAGDLVSLVSTSADPDGALVSQQWDISGNGTIDDATSASTTASFARPGRQTITLTVTDADGARSVVTKVIVVGKPRPKLLSPFPVVRIAGGLSGSNTRIRTLSISAPRGARVEVRCKGRGCPRRRVVKSRTSRATRMKPFQRTFRPNTILEVRVTARGRIGKYVRFRIRKARAPARTDACLVPGSSRPTRCPS